MDVASTRREDENKEFIALLRSTRCSSTMENITRRSERGGTPQQPFSAGGRNCKPFQTPQTYPWEEDKSRKEPCASIDAESRNEATNKTIFFLYYLHVADAFNARNASTGYYQTTRLGTLSLWGGVEVGMMVMKKETYGVVMLMCYWADGDGAANM